MSPSDAWVRQVESEVRRFASRYGATYRVSSRELAASFEIGCFHSLVNLYSKDCSATLENLQDDAFRYLTSPNGNPANFSFITFKPRSGGSFELRQQVRITSNLHDRIAFTPDLVVIKETADIVGEFDEAYASGKRRFFSVPSAEVIAAHECKSLNPFPELLVSFLGMLIAAHPWLEYPHCRDTLCDDGLHLAPTLFVGGIASLWHSRMVSALSSVYPVNVVTGMHAGTWDLRSRGVNMFDLA